VRAAEEPDAIDVMPTRTRESVHVIELERARFGASSTALVGERALSTVAFVDRAFDCVWNVARRCVARLFPRPLSLLPASREALFLHVVDQQVERRAQDAAMSPSGTRCRSRSCAWRSFSRNARSAVN